VLFAHNASPYSFRRIRLRRYRCRVKRCIVAAQCGVALSPVQGRFGILNDY